MAVQTRDPSVFLPRSEFDAFLFTEIGEDGNMPLTVLSALARGNVDPWLEAAQLARLPFEAASERLASLIGAGRMGELDFQPLARRLIGLLPRRSSVTGAASYASAVSRPNIHAIVFSAFLLAGLMGAGWVMAIRHTAESRAQIPLESARGVPASPSTTPAAVAQP